MPMKRYLLILGFALLLLTGLNLRNRTVIATSADFPTSERTLLTPRDDSRSVDITREANSLFAPPPVRTAVSGDDSRHNLRIRLADAVTFASRIQVRTQPGPLPVNDLPTIAGNGAFHRAADYYVYTLRRIVI